MIIKSKLIYTTRKYLFTVRTSIFFYKRNVELLINSLSPKFLFPLKISFIKKNYKPKWF